MGSRGEGVREGLGRVDASLMAVVERWSLWHVEVRRKGLIAGGGLGEEMGWWCRTRGGG